MLEKYLQELGLNEKEAAVYLALLQVDSAPVADLAKKTDINRTTVYPVLESLMQKGLVSETQADKKTEYQAEAPERLETFVERQKMLLEERAARVKDIIPELKSVQREQGERPVIKFFEGRDGAISAYEEFYSFTQQKDQKGYFLYNRDLVSATFSEAEQNKFLEIRHGKKVEPVSVYNRAEGDYAFITPGTRTRIDEKKYPISVDVTVIEDRTIVVTLGEKITSMVIRSKDFANTLASLITYINDKK